MELDDERQCPSITMWVLYLSRLSFCFIIYENAYDIAKSNNIRDFTSLPLFCAANRFSFLQKSDLTESNIPNLKFHFIPVTTQTYHVPASLHREKENELKYSQAARSFVSVRKLGVRRYN